MNKKSLSYDPKKPDYDILEPIVELLLCNGLELKNEFRWGNNRTGYFCHLVGNIDFDLIRESFEMPETIFFNENLQTIESMETYSHIKAGF